MRMRNFHPMRDARAHMPRMPLVEEYKHQQECKSNCDAQGLFYLSPSPNYLKLCSFIAGILKQPTVHTPELTTLNPI